VEAVVRSYDSLKRPPNAVSNGVVGIPEPFLYCVCSRALPLLCVSPSSSSATNLGELQLLCVSPCLSVPEPFLKNNPLGVFRGNLLVCPGSIC
jgi:hypothetical protein